MSTGAIRKGRILSREGPGYFGEGGLCGRALNGDHGEPVGGVIDLDGAVGGGPFVEPCRDGVTVARVWDVEVALLAEAVDDVVVDDAALFVAGHAVLGAPPAELAHVGAEYPAHERARARPADEEPTHMGNVEDPHLLADGVDLFQDGCVLHGHVPTGEGDHARAHRDVGPVKGSG